MDRINERCELIVIGPSRPILIVKDAEHWNRINPEEEPIVIKPLTVDSSTNKEGLPLWPSASTNTPPSDRDGKMKDAIIIRFRVHFAHNDHHISACGLWDNICSESRLATDDPAKVTCEVCMRSSSFLKEKRLHLPEQKA